MKALLLVEGKIDRVEVADVADMQKLLNTESIYKALEFNSLFEKSIGFYVTAKPIDCLPEVNVVNPDGTCHGTFFGPMLVVGIDLVSKNIRDISEEEVSWIKYGVDKVYVLNYRQWVHTLEIHKSTFSAVNV